MVDDALIAGAAAPSGGRLIRSPWVLDAIWVASVAALFIAVSPFPLIDLESTYLRLFDAPLRVFVLALPVVAIGVAVGALVRRSAAVGAAATGVLVPTVALGGSLAGALFLDAASPFTDAGVPLTLAAAVLGLVMLVRWFVYQPSPLPGRDRRPPVVSGRALVGLGVVLVANVLVNTVRDDVGWSSSTVVATAFMLIAPAVVLTAGLVRSVGAAILATASCVAQSVAVIVVLLEDGDVQIDSSLALRTGVVGLVVMIGAAAAAVVGVRGATVDIDERPGPRDDESWRWSADDV
jgi:hypothetical protein